MERVRSEEIRKAVRESYGKVAATGNTGGGCSPTCCSSDNDATAAEVSLVLGYSEEDVAFVPEGANMGLGCGNPQAIAALRAGETVLDLGSGAGFDCFLAARAVGDQGHVIGVDMTSEMIGKARVSADQAGIANVEFRLGEIEHLPVADGTVDVIISNCMINLSPEKAKVFREAFRVLRPGGRLAISDMVATAELPDDMKHDMALYTGCMAGASFINEIESMLSQAGFEDIRIKPKDESREFIRNWVPGRRIEDYVVSATIEARKPRA
jgi:SAM-dependent methyltransferase